ncbi:protein Shroom1 [Bombina bombina]|uniref:protein Shroom1 n=1 Tax=Bombina bombina TaxID=8345 RepID=UPI00235AF0BE|nr:protein Shroom1 [Bombina bombina]
MSSFGNIIERWNVKNAVGISELIHPMTSEDYNISPVKSVSTIVDSAYSSFSGSSYFPDYQTASFQNDRFQLNDEQVSYMDSEYVKAIYNPSATDYNLYLEDGLSNIEQHAENNSLENNRVPQMLSSEPPIPPTRHSSYITHKIFDKSKGDHFCYGNQFSQQVKRGPSGEFMSISDHKPVNHHGHWHTEEQERTLGKVNKEYNLSHDMERKDNNYYPRHSFFLQSESYCKAQDDLKRKKCLSEYEIQEQKNSKTSTTLYDEFSCTYENKHYSHMNKINKEMLKEMHLQNRNNEDVQMISYPTDHFIGHTETCLKQGEIITGVQNTKSSLSEFIPESSSVSENKSECCISKPVNETHRYSFEGTVSMESGDLEIHKSHKTQKFPLSQSIKDRDSGMKPKPHHIRSSQVFYCGPNEDLFTQTSRTLNQENEVHEGTKTLNLRKDAARKSLPLLSRQQEQVKTKRQSLYDLTCEKITKASTPMLYHLAGGRQLLKSTIPVKPQFETNSENKEFQLVSNSSIPHHTEVQINSKHLNKQKSQSQLDDHFSIHCRDDVSSENISPSAEECLMHDYREKLKVAQKKVLRETSFKRKDLQMSLPCRLKLNPPKRPSIDHFRSFSLSSANEDSKSIHAGSSVDSSYKKDEPEKPIVSRIGGRKRITKEQRKLCYSEPEKLDHVGVHNSVFEWEEKGKDLSQNEIKDSAEISKQKKSLDHKERALSSSNISKTELKQIQHNALIQYMERKTNQRPNSSQLMPMQTSNEAELSEVPQEYLSRRSTGASSSYDATVTWQTRFVKAPFLGDSVPILDPSVVTKYTSHLDQCTLEDNHKYSQKSHLSMNQRKSSQHSQVYTGTVIFSELAPCSNHGNRLVVTENSITTDLENNCAVRSRGKSMEEIGTTDKVRLSVLSQSSDQLYHKKESVTLPRVEIVNNTAVIYQDKVQASSADDPGKLPRQTSEQDLLGPHGSDVANLAQEIHSGPLSATNSFSNTDNSSYEPSKFHTGAPKQSQFLQAEDEIFVHKIITGLEMHSTSSLTTQEDTINALPQGEETTSSITNLLCLNQSGKTENHSTLSTEAYENDDLRNVEIYTNTLSESSQVSKLSVSRTDNTDLDAEREEIRSADTNSCNSQQEELCCTQPSQDNPVNCLQALHLPFGQFDEKDKVTVLESEANRQMSSDPEREEDLPTGKLKSPEDERHEELVKEIVAKDKSLADILNPLPVRESAMDLMKSLFPVDMSAIKEARNRRLPRKDDQINPLNKEILESTPKLPSKTLLLLQKNYVKKSDCEGAYDITTKKMELVSDISSKLENLCGQRELLQWDITENVTYGQDMEVVVKEVCKPNEYERYMMFIGDLEKVVSLLFSLSMRLARVENALSKVDDNTDAEEAQSLKERHSILSRQREDAKDLKENLDRRERVVTGILAKYLSEHQLKDYKHFVNLKTSFLIEQKDLDEKIKFHEEQLESLHNSISS